jgi:hypothetical protein
MMGAVVWPFLIYYLALFVACYVLVEYGQYFLYDEATPHFAAKVALGAAILAGLMTWIRPGFATMFTSDITGTVLLGIAWFGVFVLIYRFHPWHGAGIGLAAMVLLSGTIGLVVDSMLTPRSLARIDTSRPAEKPVRRPTFGGPQAPAPTPAK